MSGEATDANGEPIRGERTINAAQAEVIRRIFRAYAVGIARADRPE